MSAKTANVKDTAASRWLSYRPEIKVVDCTIRDGGLMNNHHFEDKIVKVVYEPASPPAWITWRSATRRRAKASNRANTAAGNTAWRRTSGASWARTKRA